MTKRRIEFFFSFLVFAVNFFLKLIQIGSPSLWYDEIISVQDTLLDFGHIKHEAEWDKNPPFYHYLLWVWAKCFGITEVGVRSMSAFFSALTAVLIYFFVNCLKDRVTAIMAALVFTFHPFLFYYAQEARCYSLLNFLVVADLILCYNLIRSPTIMKAVALGLVNFLIFYTHYLAALILVPQFVLILIELRARFRLIVITYLVPIVLTVIRFTPKQYRVLFFSQELSAGKKNVPIANFDILAHNLEKLFVSNIVTLAYVVLLVICVYHVVKRNRDIDRFLVYVIFSPAICVLSLYLLGLWTEVFDARYLLFCLPLAVISPFLFLRNVKLKMSICALLLMTSMPRIEFGASRLMDYRTVATVTKSIKSNFASDAIILLQTHDIVSLFLYYYERDFFMHKDRMSRERLATKNIYYLHDKEDWSQIKFDRPIIFLRTFVNKEERDATNERIRSFGFNSFEYQFQGVNFMYFWKK